MEKINDEKSEETDELIRRVEEIPPKFKCGIGEIFKIVREFLQSSKNMYVLFMSLSFTSMYLLVVNFTRGISKPQYLIPTGLFVVLSFIVFILMPGDKTPTRIKLLLRLVKIFVFIMIFILIYFVALIYFVFYSIQSIKYSTPVPLKGQVYGTVSCFFLILLFTVIALKIIGFAKKRKEENKSKKKTSLKSIGNVIIVTTSAIGVSTPIIKGIEWFITQAKSLFLT